MTQHRQPIRDKWGKTPSEVFEELLREQGIVRYATINATQDGVDLPSGIEAQVWIILTPDGIVQTYGLRWDESRTAPDGSKGYYTLLTQEPWSQEEVEAFNNFGYLRARKELGLPLTEEQERILKEADK
ncbi:MAG: hypothetical protein HYW38_01215 [Candidatus Colwellbacteria bacterium]|nr:hypothetical protein [Candidatus Colwellbacteria bacterium]